MEGRGARFWLYGVFAYSFLDVYMYINLLNSCMVFFFFSFSFFFLLFFPYLLLLVFGG
ncbi:hypothetical protein F4809DRAFT_619986 [Biscogniauxia mediterranea]|nr:hypothetical protein F4809DRAFT_619986 [Biscogniauxia mediterranea]